MKDRRMNERGFSLAEVLVGLFLFSIGALAVAKMQITAIHASAAARLRSQAVFLAEERMENLLRSDYASLAGEGSEQRTPHTIRWLVTDHGDFREILVTVGWQYQGERSLSLKSIRGDLR